jgi:transcription termination factor NusB
LSEEKKKALKKYDATIVGGIEEEKVYTNLSLSLQENNVKNTVVINGLKAKTQSGMVTGEFDFLIVSEPLQTIFHIEVKKSCSKNTSDSAAKQLDRGLKLIENAIPFPEEETWNYVRLMYFGFDKQKSEIFCSECQKFVLGTSQEIWPEITKNIENLTNQNQLKSTYRNILNFFLYNMYKQGNGTAEQLINETTATTDAMTTLKNIFFWSKEQLTVLHDTKETKRIAFASEFGTGKTVLLKAKARELLGIKEPKETGTGKISKRREKVPQSEQHNQRVVIAIFEGKTKDIALKLEYEKQFQNTDAKIVGIQGIDGNYLKLTKKKLCLSNSKYRIHYFQRNTPIIE